MSALQIPKWHWNYHPFPEMNPNVHLQPLSPGEVEYKNIALSRSYLSGDKLFMEEGNIPVKYSIAQIFPKGSIGIVVSGFSDVTLPYEPDPSMPVFVGNFERTSEGLKIRRLKYSILGLTLKMSDNDPSIIPSIMPTGINEVVSFKNQRGYLKYFPVANLSSGTEATLVNPLTGELSSGVSNYTAIYNVGALIMFKPKGSPYNYAEYHLAGESDNQFVTLKPLGIDDTSN
jgi:hypothetical protein